MTGSWDPIWERIHREREWGGAPIPSFLDAIRRRTSQAVQVDPEATRQIRVLDIGCGGGAVTLALAQAQFQVVAFDASSAAAELCYRRLEMLGLDAEVWVMKADEILQQFGPESFDWVIDMVTIQHNPPEVQREIVRQIKAVLKPGGWVYSRMAATGSWGEGMGRQVAERTWTDVTEGPACQRGTICFSSRQDIMDLWGWLDMQGNFLLDHRIPSDWAHKTFLGTGTDREREWWCEWVIEGRKQCKPDC